jgi:hypothetical protein
MKAVTGVRQEQKAVLQAGKKQCSYDDCISIRCIVDCPHGHVGDMMNKSSSVARELVKRGLAEYVFPYEAKDAPRVSQPTATADTALPSLLRAYGHVMGG